MTILKAGQKLWWVDYKKHTEGYVIIADITDTEILVWYNGEIKVRPFSVLGKTLFLTPQLNKQSVVDNRAKSAKIKKPGKSVKQERVPMQKKEYVSSKKFSPIVHKEEKIENRFFEDVSRSEKSCETCALRRNGECGSLCNQLCEDYRALQSISAEERNAYPQYGDATALRKRDRKHFK